MKKSNVILVARTMRFIKIVAENKNVLQVNSVHLESIGLG